MDVITRITFLDENGEKFFGEGPARLLQAIEEYGSLRSAAMSMNMAYTKALKIMKNAEKAIGFPLTARMTGGKDGGGSTLTPEGKVWLTGYLACRDACDKKNREIVRSYFPVTGCVIMASGMSRRFGSNKLLEDFHGRPMILQILKATEGIFARRVVVTRHPEVAQLCREQGAEAVLHDLPNRSDTIRLGLEALGDIDCCMFVPGDQPLLRKETMKELLRCWDLNRENIIRPVCGEIPGAPVVFPQWSLTELVELPKGKGGNHVMKMHPERVLPMEISDPYELMDADTPEILEQLRQREKILYDNGVKDE